MLKRNDLFCTAVIAAFALAAAAAPAAAEAGSSNAKAKPTVRVTSAKPATTTKAQTPKTQTAKVKATGATKASSPKVSSKPAAAKAGPKSSAKRAEPTSAFPTAPTRPTADTNPTGPTVPLNKAQQLLMKNGNLRLKLQTRLGGMDPIVAASGFRNLGQFVAAVNVSFNNPGVQFRALKALMTGTPPMSLGQALQQLRGLEPAVASTTANAALAQADTDILTSTTIVRKTNGKK